MLAPSSQPLDLLLADEFDRPLWRSLLANLGETVAPEKLPPLHLTSRPVDVGPLLSDRLETPWYRTVFTNIGDVLSPEVLPPLELESRPVDVGELVGDQLSHLWLTSMIRGLADLVAPERLPALELTSKPEDTILPSKIMLLPQWSTVIDGPKLFYPDPLKAISGSTATAPRPALPATPPEPVVEQLEYLHVMEHDLRRDLGRSRFRARIWMALASAQVLFLVGMMLWKR